MDQSTQSTTPAVKLPNYITLSSLCEKHGIDARHARMKLRKAGFKPSSSGVWEWARDDESLSWVLVELLKK